MKIYYSKKRKIEWWDNFNHELLNKIIKIKQDANS